MYGVWCMVWMSHTAQSFSCCPNEHVHVYVSFHSPKMNSRISMQRYYNCQSFPLRGSDTNVFFEKITPIENLVLSLIFLTRIGETYKCGCEMHTIHLDIIIPLGFNSHQLIALVGCIKSYGAS